MRKVLSILLAMCMVMSILPVIAGAAEYDTIIVDGCGYNILSDNLVTMELSEYTKASNGGVLGWTSVDMSRIDSSIADGTMMIHFTGNVTGGTGANTMRTFFPIEGGKTYYVANKVYNNSGITTISHDTAGMSAMIATGSAVYGTFSGLTMYSHVDYGGFNSWSNESAPTIIGTRVSRTDKTAVAGMNTFEAIIEAPADAKNIMVSYGAWGITDLYYGDITIYEVEANNQCGDNCYWELDDEGTLTISGSGSMNDFATIESAPWYSFASDIKNVVIEDGVTSVSSYAFCGLNALESITIADSVEILGDYFISNGSADTEIEIYIPKGVVEIKDNAFANVGYTISSITVDEENTAYKSENNMLLTKDGTELFAVWGTEAVEFPEGVVRVHKGVEVEGCYWPTNGTGTYTIPYGTKLIGDNSNIGGNVTTIRLPDTLIGINEAVFANATSLATILYEGTEEEWAAINLDSNPVDDSTRTIKFNHMSIIRNTEDAEVLWGSPDGRYSGIWYIDEVWSGWTSDRVSGVAHFRSSDVGNAMMFYDNVTGYTPVDIKVKSPGYGELADKVIIEWSHVSDASYANNLYFDFSFRDIDGNEIAFLKLDKNFIDCDYTASDGNYYAMGYPADGTDMAIVAYNNADGITHTAEYYVDGALVATQNELEGTINGFKSIVASGGEYSEMLYDIGFANLTVAAVVPDLTEVTVDYTIDGEVADSIAKRYRTNVDEGVTFDEYFYSANGSDELYKAEGMTVSENTSVEMTKIENWGDYTTGDVIEYNEIPYTVMSDNIVPNGNFANGLGGWYNGTGSVAKSDKFRANDDGTVTALTNEGYTSEGALYRAWPVTEGELYMLKFTSSMESIYFNVSEKDNLTTTADGNIIHSAVEGDNTVVFKATKPYVQINFRWMDGSATVGNFALHQVETPLAITAIGNIDIGVIGDTVPKLPATVSVTSSHFDVTEGSVVWNMPESFNVGENTVTGVVTATFDGQTFTEETSATVTVLSEVFTLDDFTSAGDQASGKLAQLEFPKSLTGSFNMEFIANYASFGDLWIMLKTKDSNFFGPEQIALGVNASGQFRAVNGDGYGYRETEDTTLATLSTGVDYRFFITADALTDEYTIKVYDVETGALLAKAENFGFRTNATAIEAITALTNNGVGSVTISDIKVNTPVQKLSAKFYDADGTVIKSVSQVVMQGDSYTIEEEEIFVIDKNNKGHFYQIPKTVLVSNGSDEEFSIDMAVSEIGNKYAAIEDAFVTDDTVWGIGATNEYSVFVSGGASADTNGEDVYGNYTANLAKTHAGLVQFPVVKLTEGQKATANFYVRGWHAYTWQKDDAHNEKIRLAAQIINDDSWTRFTDGATYVAKEAPVFENYSGYTFSDWATSSTEYVTFDITEAMMAAEAAGLETITMKLSVYLGGAYIAEREACVEGGAYEGKASYISVSSAERVKVTADGSAILTKNGSAMSGFAYVTAEDDVRLVGAKGEDFIGTDEGYYIANSSMNFTEAASFVNTYPCKLGLSMIEGAQIRIGNTELEDGELPAVMADSGLRFLAKADYTDTVLNDSRVEFGIKITAEDSNRKSYIKAENFQNDDNSVFSAAITNLSASNYNRDYTATAYAKIPMADGSVKEVTAGSITRSIYKVATGIMKNNSADAEKAPYDVSDGVKAVLNAYINQVGIRLTMAKDYAIGISDVYTGDVFFNVSHVTNDDGSTLVTIVPCGEAEGWSNSVDIASWWKEYVRINNNNSSVKSWITNDSISENGVLTFTFTPVISTTE